MEVCNCSVFCCTLIYVHSGIAIILMGKRELIALLSLSSWCLVVVGRLFLAVPRGCLRFVIVVFPDHTHLLFSIQFPDTKPKCRFSITVHILLLCLLLKTATREVGTCHFFKVDCVLAGKRELSPKTMTMPFMRVKCLS